MPEKRWFEVLYSTDYGVTYIQRHGNAFNPMAQNVRWVDKRTGELSPYPDFPQGFVCDSRMPTICENRFNFINQIYASDRPRWLVVRVRHAKPPIKDILKADINALNRWLKEHNMGDPPDNCFREFFVPNKCNWMEAVHLVASNTLILTYHGEKIRSSVVEGFFEHSDCRPVQEEDERCSPWDWGVHFFPCLSDTYSPKHQYITAPGSMNFGHFKKNLRIINDWLVSESYCEKPTVFYREIY